jgi:hypothetical protein
MKKLFVLICLMIVVVTTNAQSRTNVTGIKFYSKSEKLERASGWEYHEATGKWYENENVIYPGVCQIADIIFIGFNLLLF